MSIIHAIASVFAFIGSLFVSAPVAPAPQPVALAAAVPSSTAVFETSLASAITSSASSMTLTANSVRGGGSISGYNCFVVDEGSAQAETICGTVSGTSVTSLTRGISQATGTTTVAALQFSHRRGANVKISDFPIVQILKALANGEDTFPNPLTYAVHPCTAASASTTICDKNYQDQLVAQGSPTSTQSVGGINRLATLAQQADSTDLGANDPLVLQAKNSTSTCQVVGSYNVVASSTTGKIDKNCIDPNAQYTLASTTITAFTSTNVLTNNATTSNLHVTSVTSSILKTDTNGRVKAAVAGSDYAVGAYNLATTTSASTVNTSFATSTGFLNIPANVLTGSSTIHIRGSLSCQDTSSGGKSCSVHLKDSIGVTMCIATLNTPTTQTTLGFFDMLLIASNSTSAQKCIATMVPTNQYANSSSGATSYTTSSVNLANAFTPAIAFVGDSNSATTLSGYVIEIRP